MGGEGGGEEGKGEEGDEGEEEKGEKKEKEEGEWKGGGSRRTRRRNSRKRRRRDWAQPLNSLEALVGGCWRLGVSQWHTPGGPVGGRGGRATVTGY